MQNYTRYDALIHFTMNVLNMDSIGKYMHEITLHQQRTSQVLKQKKLMQTQDDHSSPISALNVDSLKQVSQMIDADDADIRPIYDEEPMAEGKLFGLLQSSKVDSEPPHEINVDIPLISCMQTNSGSETVTTSNELDVLFGPLFDEYFNGENQVVLKSSAVTTTDASNKRQQQPDSTSSTSTLATTITANGNFDL
ncbi:hypothetical protein Tco_1346309 [Tanacetum coccineum]